MTIRASGYCVRPLTAELLCETHDARAALDKARKVVVAHAETGKRLATEAIELVGGVL